MIETVICKNGMIVLGIRICYRFGLLGEEE